MAKILEFSGQDLTGLIGEVIDLDGVAVNRETRFGQDLAVSSSQMLRIVSRIQGRYQVQLAPSEILTIRNFGDLEDLLRKRLAGPRP